ncbi:MAG: hypothetical protein SFU25_02425 [Candidatus Caenarcaniphilales bacterium]|nr:hypothetical protein [Candidatus Caenarcaniphilales bacterium]
MNYKKFIGGFFVVVLLCGLILPVYLGFHFREKIQNPKFIWSVLNLKIHTIVGSRLKCKDVKWCGNLKLCASLCETDDGLLLIERFNYSIPNGYTLVENWKLKSFPKKITDRKDFPQIPLLINRMEFRNGDLSKVAKNIPVIEIIQMQRSSPLGQRWETEVKTNTISLSGFTGDSSYLTLKLQNYIIQESRFSSVLNGNILFTNNAFKRKPFFVSTEDFSFSEVSLNGVPTEDFKLALSLVTNSALDKLREVKTFNLKSQNINLHSKVLRPYSLFGFPRKVRLILEPVRASFFTPYLKDELAKYKLSSLAGQISGESLINLSELKKSRFKLFFKPLNFYLAPNNSNLGSINGFLTFADKNITDAKLEISNIQLKDFNALLGKQDLEFVSGELNGKLTIEKKKAKGEFTLSKANLKDSLRKISLSDGSGKFVLKDKELQGLAIFSLLDNPLNRVSFSVKALFNDLKKPKINLDFTSPQIAFQNFTLEKNNLTFNGLVKNLFGKISFEDPQNPTLNLEFEPSRLSALSPQIGQKKVEFVTGKIKYGSNTQLDVYNLKAKLADDEFLLLNGNFKLPEKQPLEPLKVRVESQTKLSTLLEILPLLNKDIKREFLQNIQNPTGYLSSDFEILDSKLHKLKLNLQNVGLLYKNQKITNGSGKLSFPGYGVLEVGNLSLLYGNKSSLFLNGKLEPSKEFLTTASINSFLDSVASFDGNLQGLIDLNDFIDKKTQQKLNFALNSEALLPINAEIKPIEGGMFESKVSSIFKNLGSLNSNLFPADKLSTEGFFNADILVRPSDGYFKLEDFECALNGLNIAAEAEGKPENFNLKLYTDPVIDLGQLFDTANNSVNSQTPNLRGALIGWVESNNINAFDKKSFWNNLKLSLRTDELQSIEIGPLELTSLEGYFESKGGKGYSTLVVDKGIIKNLPFNELNVAFNLKDNYLQMPGLAFKTAGGDVNLNGNIELANWEGHFVGDANNLNVGTIARGLSGQRGLSGTGDFTFKVDGHLGSLIKGEKPVFGAGSFNLKNGNTSAVLDLQKKLNLANLVFNGPLALNINSLLEFLSPTTNGYYRALYGRWEVDKDWILIPEASYRGTNKLNLNTSGHFERKNSKINFNFIGSIPRIPVRVNPGSEFSNIFSQLNFANILGHLPIIDKIIETRPRVFSFNMNGNYNNQQQLNSTSSSSFKWLDSGLHSNLPKAKIPSRNGSTENTLEVLPAEEKPLSKSSP